MAVQSLWTAIPSLRMCIPNLQTEKLNAVHKHMQHAAHAHAARCIHHRNALRLWSQNRALF